MPPLFHPFLYFAKTPKGKKLPRKKSAFKRKKKTKKSDVEL